MGKDFRAKAMKDKTYEEIYCKKKMNINKTTITIVILVGLVLIFGMLFGIEVYKDYRLERDIQVYTQGQIDIARLSVSCEPVTIYLDENKSISLIAIGCLNQGVGK